MPPTLRDGPLRLRGRVASTRITSFVVGLVVACGGSPSALDDRDRSKSASLIVQGANWTTLELVSDTGGTSDTLVMTRDASIFTHSVSPDGEYVAYVTRSPSEDHSILWF